MAGEQLNSNRDYLYDAFISYRHSEPDMTIALELHKAIENYRIPGNIAKKAGIKKFKRLFRDREELPTSSNLSNDITNALMNSRFLIVVCSPRTPESKWCCREIEEFREFHKENGRILSILIEGEPRESFPEILHTFYEERINPDGSTTKVKVETEPLAADIRGTSFPEMIKKLRVEKLRLLAPMLGVRFDDLRQRHREALMKRVIALSAGISLFFAAFGAVALIQSNVIKDKNIELTKQRDKLFISDSKFLAEKSESMADGRNMAGAMSLALEGLPKNIESPDRPYVQEAEWALLKAVMSDGKYMLHTALTGHNGYVDIARYSGDSKYILTASADKVIRIWDAGSGNKITDFTKHNGGYYGISCAEFSKDGKYVLSASYWDNNVYLWDAGTGKLVHDLSFYDKDDVEYMDNSVSYASFSPDSEKIMILFLDGLHIYDAKSGNEISRIKLLDDFDDGRAENDVRAQDDVKGIAAFSSKGDKIAVTCESRNDVRGYIIDVATGKKLAVFDTNLRFSTMSDRNIVKYSPDDRYILASTFSGAVLLDGQTGKTVLDLQTKGGAGDFIAADFSSDGKYMAIGFADTNECTVYDLDSLKEVFKTEYRDAVKFNPFSSSILVNGTDIIDLSKGKKVNTLQYDSGIYNLNASPDGKYLISGCLDNTARIWNLGAGIGAESIDSFNEKIDGRNNVESYPTKRNVDFSTKHSYDPAIYGNPLQLYSVSRDGRYVAFSYPDGVVELYDIDSTAGDTVESFSVTQALTSTINVLQFSPTSNRFLAASFDGRMIVYDMEQQSIVGSMDIGKEYALEGALFSPDGKWIAAYNYHNKLYLWNAQNCDMLFTADLDRNKEVSDIGFTKDGKYLVAVYEDGSALKVKLFTGSQELIDYARDLITK